MHLQKFPLGSSEVGQIIAEAMEKVGRDGVISVDTSNGFETELEISRRNRKAFLTALTAYVGGQ